MKDIKFRVWDLKKKFFWHPNNNGETTFQEVFSDEDSAVQQYIGLDDKFGKKIFEGDIVQCYVGILGLTKSGIPKIVKWDEKLLMWDIPRRQDESLFNNYEVIGNMYEE